MDTRMPAPFGSGAYGVARSPQLLPHGVGTFSGLRGKALEKVAPVSTACSMEVTPWVTTDAQRSYGQGLNAPAAPGGSVAAGEPGAEKPSATCVTM
ncbi:hypothetical protein ACFVZC_03935 [Streptomyces marokkonensis]|uniref:Uncharacterized protein n=1 Tax=Streptomyces marokkonensis TaxID=324855 RepID=A0ABW6Q042_9ACTN